MKILNINSYYYSSSVHKQLQNALQKHNNIDAFTYVPVARGYIAREECRYGKEEYVKRVECYNEIDRYVFHIKHGKILKNIIKEIDIAKYNCLHAHSLFSNGYIAMKIKEKYGIPYIVAVRDTDVNIFFKEMLHLRKLGNEILQKADAIVFLSKAYRDNMINNYINNKYKNNILLKSYVIPSGIDDFWLNNKNSPKRLESEKNIRLLHVGAVSKRKNILTTTKAIKILEKKGYNVNLTVVGKVIDEKVYKKILNYNFIKYVSPKPKERLLEIYRENDIFVMPSITETFGLVYPEAMSQGLPVIYTRGQGFDGQFEDGEVGYSVDCFNANEIAEKIIETVNNYNRITKNCIKYCDRFAWRRVVALYELLYKNIRMDRIQ